MSKYDVSKFKLKFDKPREQKPTEQKPTEDNSAKIDTVQKAAKKRWWEISNLGANIGSNKKSIFDKKE